MKPLPPIRPVLRHAVLAVTVTSLLASCATAPVPSVRRDSDLSAFGNAGVAGTRGATAANAPMAAGDGAVAAQPLAEEAGRPQAQIRRGTGQMINRSAANAPRPMGGGSSGAATFNFEGESLHAVVKVILGDMLGQNYVIAPGVQGTVTLATPKPVSSADALNLLEMVLGWNNARMVYGGGRYNIVPADQALAGTVAPSTGPAQSARGFEVRAVPLRYVSATEMEKILKPYARPNAIVNVDNARNIISVGGSRAELDTYLRTIETFDVDWLGGMSVGVFPLQGGRATRVVADLERVFGENSKSPVAGMFRFMPLEGANAIMVITSQPNYLDDIRQWLERIDNASNASKLYSYELKYIKARDLADQLAEVFGGARAGGSGGNGGAPSLMPGLDPVELQDRDGGASAVIGGGEAGSMGGTGGSGATGSTLSLGAADNRSGSVTLEVEGDRVGVSAVAETNSLLVRASPAAWASIRDVIEKLDVMPLQVHIEAQVVEVQLSGALEYGVNWYFENAVSDPVASGGAGLPSALGRTIWGDIRGSVRAAQPAGSTTGLGGVAWTFLGRNAAAVISALDQITDLQVLQTPSVFVRNNAEATLNVGSRIPIESVTVNPGLGNETSFSQVQYLDTGIILKVRPRITRDGMVFLDIVQEVSSPGARESGQRNVRIDTRRVKTETAVPDGDTVMLAGLISDGVTKGSSGLPGLSRIPVIGGLFGTQSSRTERNEVIVLLTPRVVRDPQELRQNTDDYGRRFRALEPLYRTPKP